MRYFEDYDKEMDMPCLCDRCGEWFELNKGKSVPGTSVLYCNTCAKEKTDEYNEDFK